MFFDDRKDAGRQLAARLTRFKDQQPIILGLPRGGVVVANEVAKALDAPLDVLLVRKIGAPGRPELAVGAVAFVDKPETVIVDDVKATLDVPKRYLKDAEAEQVREIKRRQEMYGVTPGRLDVRRKTAILVDDGIATGATIRAAVRALRRAKPRRLVVAVPVAPPDAVAVLEREADEVVCVAVDSDLGAISLSYGAFPQVGDDEVIDILERSRRGGVDEVEED